MLTRRTCEIPWALVRQLVKQGALPGYRVGRALAVRRTDLEAWLARTAGARCNGKTHGGAENAANIGFRRE
jgi:excisionase family DNA binding protein